MALQTVQSHRTQVLVSSTLDVLLGLWVAISPMVLNYGMAPTSAANNDFVIGAIVVLLSLARFSPRMDNAPWVSWYTVILGLWLAFSPLFLGFKDFEVAATNNVVSGIAIVLIAMWNAFATKSTDFVKRGSRYDNVNIDRSDRF